MLDASVQAQILTLYYSDKSQEKEVFRYRTETQREFEGCLEV